MTAVERADILCQTDQVRQMYLWGFVRDSHALPLCVLILKILSSLAALYTDQMAAMLSS